MEPTTTPVIYTTVGTAVLVVEQEGMAQMVHPRVAQALPTKVLTVEITVALVTNLVEGVEVPVRQEARITTKQVVMVYQVA